MKKSNAYAKAIRKIHAAPDPGGGPNLVSSYREMQLKNRS